MHKDAQAYFDAIAAADKAFTDGREALNTNGEYMVPVWADRYDEKWAPKWRAYSNAERGLRDACRNAKVAAWNKLAGSELPLIAWIGVNVSRDYRNHVETILPLIGDDGVANLVAMDEAAVQGDWCAEWSRLVTQATEAGVLGGGTVGAAELELWRYIRRSINSQLYNRQIAELRERVINALAEAHASTPSAQGETEEVKESE